METLDQIGRRFGSDKFTRHDFGPIYDRVCGHLRLSATMILEIGIGGEEYADGGESLLTWREYFPSANILGIDIYDKRLLDGERIKTEICDQRSVNDLKRIGNAYGPFDVIIDDGSHVGSDAITSLRVLFNHLRAGGIYVIEDLQTSYWSNYGGSSIAPDWFDTTLKWLKGTIDIINKDELVITGEGHLDHNLGISELHVFHNIAFVFKEPALGAGRSRVLSEEMRSHFSQHDRFHNAGLTSSYELYRNEAESFRQLISFVQFSPDETKIDQETVASPELRSRSIEFSAEHFNETMRMKAALAEQREINKNFEDHVSTLTGYIGTLEAEKKDSESVLSLHSLAIKDFENHVFQLKDYIKSLESEKQDREVLLGSHSTAIKQFETHVSNLQVYIEDLEADKRSRETMLSSHSTAIKDFEAHVSDLKSYIEDLESANRSRETMLSSHSTAIKDFEAHVSDLQAYIEDLESDKRSRETVLSSHSTAIKDFEAHVSDLQAYIEDLESDKRSRETMLSSHSTAIKDFENYVSDLNIYIKKIESTK